MEKFRHEVKHSISYADMLTLQQKLKHVVSPDGHTDNGRYLVKSLYFDTPSDRAYQDNLDGVSHREKFRIRYYNQDLSFIRLEKKCKMNNLGQKFSAVLTKEEVQRILLQDISFLAASSDSLLLEFYTKLVQEQLKPKSIVVYDRIPYTYAPGNVRITLDHHIRTSTDISHFLDPELSLIPVDDSIILEVKWDAFLPDISQDLIQLDSIRASAYSKYKNSRSSFY